MTWLRMTAFLLLLVGMAAPAAAQGTAAQGTLERVRQAGLLRCGVSSAGVGLSAVDQSGRWQGFFVDLCRALSAAVLGSADLVEFVEVSSQNRFAAVRDGVVDVTMEGSTWTLHRDATFGIDFPVTYMFDGQGFMAHRSLGAERLSEVRRGTVCVLEGTTTERNLGAWMAARGIEFAVRTVRSTEGALTAFFNHHCDLYANDRIGLHAQRHLNAPRLADYVIFPDIMSKEPLGPMVKAGDPQWLDVVRWTVFATVLAEEMGIGSADAAFMKDNPDPEVRRLLGLTPGIGEGLGLDDAWAWRIVTQIGNYGEIYDRHLGRNSPLKIDRGPNNLWNRGGLLFAPPLGG